MRARLDRACAAVGRDPASLSLALFAGLCVGGTEGEVAQRLEALLAEARPHMRKLDAWVLGTPERAAARLRELGAAGVRRVMFSVEHELHRAMLPLLGERVAPLVREGG